MTTSSPTAAGFYLFGDFTMQVLAPPVPTHRMAFAVARASGRQSGEARLELVGSAASWRPDEYPEGPTVSRWRNLIMVCADPNASIDDIARAAAC